MIKRIFLSSLLLSGGLLIAGQAIGQFQSQDQALQRERTETNAAGVNSSGSSLGTGQTGSGTGMGTTDQQSGINSGTSQQFGNTTQQDTDPQFNRQRTPQQQEPLQQQFGVSPRYQNQGDLESGQRQNRDRSEDMPGGSSDMTREQDQGLDQGRSPGGSGMQTGPNSGGIGGSGGSGMGGSGGGAAGGSGGGGR